MSKSDEVENITEQTFALQQTDKVANDATNKIVVNTLLDNYFKHERRRSLDGNLANFTTTSSEVNIKGQRSLNEEGNLDCIAAYAKTPQNVIY